MTLFFVALHLKPLRNNSLILDVTFEKVQFLSSILNIFLEFILMLSCTVKEAHKSSSYLKKNNDSVLLIIIEIKVFYLFSIYIYIAVYFLNILVRV